MLSFKRFIAEGNPLARNYGLEKKGYHSVLISPNRKDRKPEENKAAAKGLEAALKKGGFGYRKAEGKWDEGGGVGREPSYQVIAKRPGIKGAAELRLFARHQAKGLHQDAFIHMNDKGVGTGNYTNNTPDGHRPGQKETFGTRHNNVDNPYGETQYKPSRPEKLRPKFTFK